VAHPGIGGPAVPLADLLALALAELAAAGLNPTQLAGRRCEATEPTGPSHPRGPPPCEPAYLRLTD
jgi:hypothetical protein